ncbi:MAG: bifunctional heptose 7-phosphate kinase/heptose 1-phosphate adenyltransferase [Thermoanaerobaculia bacterium]
MASQPVVMAVDLVADRFITGSPKRISREAPVLILRHESDRFVPGGGANAVANVSALGGQPLPIGVVGDDESGRAILDAFGERDIDTAGIAVSSAYSTPTKVRVMGGAKHAIKQQIVRYDIEDEVDADTAISRVHSAALAAWGGRAAVAVLSDYGYGAVTPSLIRPVRAALSESGRVLCDSRYRLADFSGIDGATPNEEEAEALHNTSFNDDAALLTEAGQAIRAQLEADFVLVTRGSLGMSLFLSDGAAHIPIHGSDQVADVTGAGDTVIGTFALALAAGSTPLEAALLANFSGGIVVQKSGTATASPSELDRALDTGDETLREVRWESF